MFGWTLRRDSDEPAFADAGGYLIGHFVSGEPTVADAGPRPFVYVEELDEALRRITGHGGRLAKPPYDEGTLRVASFHDPEGNLIGVWTQTHPH